MTSLPSQEDKENYTKDALVTLAKKEMLTKKQPMNPKKWKSKKTKTQSNKKSNKKLQNKSKLTSKSKTKKMTNKSKSKVTLIKLSSLLKAKL